MSMLKVTLPGMTEGALGSTCTRPMVNLMKRIMGAHLPVQSSTMRPKAAMASRRSAMRACPQWPSRP